MLLIYSLSFILTKYITIRIISFWKIRMLCYLVKIFPNNLYTHYVVQDKSYKTVQ